MPRIAHEADPQRVLSATERLVLTVLLQEINLLREAVGAPPRTPQDIRQAIRGYLRAHRPHQQGT